jgi:hypothetical protein
MYLSPAFVKLACDERKKGSYLSTELINEGTLRSFGMNPTNDFEIKGFL